MKNEIYDDEKQIECKCQSCDEITLHTFLTDGDDDDDAETTVQCTVCEETRDYSPKKSLKKAAGKKAAANSKAGGKEKNGVNDFKKLLTKHDVNAVIQYAMTNSFKLSDVINHKSFGIGFVRETIFPNKIEVLFSEGLKLLVCAPHVDKTLSLKAALSPQKKAAPKSRNPAAWQPWSSASDEKKEEKFGWEDNELSE